MLPIGSKARLPRRGGHKEGGVGKDPTAISLATALAATGWRVHATKSD